MYVTTDAEYYRQLDITQQKFKHATWNTWQNKYNFSAYSILFKYRMKYVIQLLCTLRNNLPQFSVIGNGLEALTNLAHSTQILLQ
jgi:hypothetical protein